MSATITNVAVTSNLATITTSGSHGFFPGQTLTIVGLANAVLNVVAVIDTTPSATTFTFGISTPNVVSQSDSGTATLSMSLAPGTSWVSVGTTAAAVSSTSIPIARGVALWSTSAFAVGFNGGITFEGAALTDGFPVPANTLFEVPPGLWPFGTTPNLDSLYLVAGGTVNVWLIYPRNN